MKYRNITLLLLFIFLAFFGLAAFIGRDIIGAEPLGCAANDCFVHLSYTEFAQRVGDWKVYPSYISLGYTDVIAFNPPIYYLLSALLAIVGGFSTFKALYLMCFVAIVLSIFLMFLIIKKYDENVAWLSIPVMIFIFFDIGASTVIRWGTWPFLFGSMFLLAMIYFIDKPVMVALFLTAMSLTHTSEFIFACLFIPLWVLFQRPFWKTVKKYVLAGIVSVIGSGYYLWIFYNTWVKNIGGTSDFIKPAAYTNFPVMLLTHFGWALIPIILGLIISAYYFFKTEEKTPFLFSYFMLGIGFTYLIGWGTRAFQTRYFWPIYLAIFFGMTFNLIFGKLKKIIPLISILLCIPILCFASFGITEERTISLLDTNRWDSFEWIEANTPENSTFLYLYSPNLYAAAVLFNSKRVPCLVYEEEFWKENITDTYTCRLLGESKSRYSHFNKWPFIKQHINNTYDDFITRPICTFDYTVITSVQSYQPTIDRQIKIAKHLIGDLKYEVVYGEKPIILLKNKRCEE